MKIRRRSLPEIQNDQENFELVRDGVITLGATQIGASLLLRDTDMFYAGLVEIVAAVGLSRLHEGILLRRGFNRAYNLASYINGDTTLDDATKFAYMKSVFELEQDELKQALKLLRLKGDIPRAVDPEEFKSLYLESLRESEDADRGPIGALSFMHAGVAQAVAGGALDGENHLMDMNPTSTGGLAVYLLGGLYITFRATREI